MVKKCQLSEAEELLGSYMDDTESFEDVIELDSDAEIVLDKKYVYVETFNVCLRHGVLCVWDEEAGIFMPDEDVTVIYEGAGIVPEYISYESEGMTDTLCDFLKDVATYGEIESVWCEVIIPECGEY